MEMENKVQGKKDSTGAPSPDFNSLQMIPGSKYQLVLLGYEHPLKDNILESMQVQISQLGIDTALIRVIGSGNFEKVYDKKSPSVVVYFGNKHNPDIDQEIITQLKGDSALILPVIENKETYRSQVPKVLHSIHGFELKSQEEISPLVNYILEGFGLLRIARRLFISYKRSESTGVAIQLFEVLEKAGFDVFLDTHSVRPGDEFQEQLWHRFADTDVGVILDSPQFLKSRWTAQELAVASSMGIGILRIIWPEHTSEAEAALTYPLKLSPADFIKQSYSTKNSKLINSAAKDIVRQVEYLRARSLASRRDTIITEFFSYCNKAGVTASLQGDRFITFEGFKDVIIPTVGVPDAFTYNQSSKLIREIREDNVENIWLLYDNRNIQEKWLDHLSWLDNHLPIKSIKITELEQWLTRNIKN